MTWHFFYLVPLALVGAVTVGVFVGISIGRWNSREWLELKDERIAVQEKIILTQNEMIGTYQAAIERRRELDQGANRHVTKN